MATFSENQVRHLYVVNDASKFTAAKSADGALFFTMPGADGKAQRSDMIENIISAKATKADDMSRNTKVAKIVMDPTALDSITSNPIPGEDYTVKIEYRQFIAQSDEVFYHEMAMAHATSASTVSSLLLDLAKNLVLNTKKQGMVEILIDTATTGVRAVEGYVEGTDGAVTAILIKEIEQPWILGVKKQEPVLFTVTTGTVVVSGDEMRWGVVTDESATEGTKIGNGKTIADMEYFYHGERGDIYRNISWPNVIPTEYMVDATKEYDAIDIHYAYVGANHAVQKSEKTITIVCPADNTSAVGKAVIAKITAVDPTLPLNL